MNNIQYWTERALLQEQRSRDQSDKLLSNLKKEYAAAQKNLQEQIDTWYKKYGEENKISPAQARKKLTAAQKRQHNQDIEDFIAKAKTGDKKYEKELRQRYIASRVSRLQSLQNQAALQLELLGKSQDVKTYKLLQEIYKDTYYHGLYNASAKTGLHGRFDRLSTEAVEQICKTPWSNKSFSERIWSNNDKLIKEVRSILSQGAMRGTSIDRMSRQLAKRMEVDYHRAECLIRTESAFVREQAAADAYKQMGVKRYQYLATLDRRTSFICRSLDNQVFAVSEKAAGVNYPPMHPRCRSTTIPYYEDEFTVGETRAAKDSDGHTIRTNAKLSYNDWYQSYIINPEPLTETGLKVFMGTAMYDKMTTKDWQQMTMDAANIPPEHMTYINEHLQGINHCSVSPYNMELSHYDWINRIIYLRDDLLPGEFMHEIGHMFEYELDIYHNPIYTGILKNALHGYETGDLTIDMTTFARPVLVLRDKGGFISDNQRIINTEMLYVLNGAINPLALTEYLAEGYRFNAIAPETLKVKNKALYDFINKEMMN